jgi:integrase
MARFPDHLPESLRRLLPPGCSLFPRPQKRRWVLAYERACGGRPQKVLGKEITEPRAALEAALAFLAAQGIDPRANLQRRHDHGPTVKACADRWIQLAEKDPKVAPATLAGYRYHLTHVLPRFGDMPIVQLAPPILRAWIREGFEDVGARTVRHAVSTFTVLVDCAIAEGWIKVAGDDWTRRAVNPLRSPAVRSILPEIDDVEPLVLPIEWVQVLVDAVDVVPLERRARYAVGFCQGLRDGEIAGLKLARLQLVEVPGVLEVAISVATVGKKEGTAWAQPKSTKTKGSRRKLPIHLAAHAAILEWVTIGWEQLVGRRPGPDDYLFPRPDGQAYRPRSAEMLREDLAACGLPTTLDGRAIDFKCARSSFATWLDEMGVERLVRKRLMGHSIGDVTERHYTRRELEQLAAAVNRIALIWPGTLPAMVPAGTTTLANSEFFGSHLRDLNSRPTVYERDDPGPAMVPGRLSRPTKRALEGAQINGQGEDNGLAPLPVVVPPGAARRRARRGRPAQLPAHDVAQRPPASDPGAR